FLIDWVGRQRANPGEGVIGALIAEHGDTLDDVVLGGFADGFFLGGYETSASMLGLGTYVLIQHPEALARVADDDAALDATVEEMLRYLSVVQLAFPRIARHDIELHGQRIRAGDLVGVSLSGANRDRAMGPDADEFSPETQRPSHLAFSHGIHRCVGAELARLELRCAFRGLVRRFPDIALAIPPDQLNFRGMSAVYGIESLPVRLSTADSATPTDRTVADGAPMRLR
ncbi:MAG: cytochrome P450, partial [Nocardioidaceae bacterium]